MEVTGSGDGSCWRSAGWGGGRVRGDDELVVHGEGGGWVGGDEEVLGFVEKVRVNWGERKFEVWLGKIGRNMV